MKPAVAVVICLFGLFLFVPDYGVQLASSLLGIVIITGLVSSRYTARGLKVVRRDRVIRVYKNQHIHIELNVENHSIFSQEYLYISDEYGPLFGGEGSKKMIALKPGERTRVCYELDARERGGFTVGPLTVRGSDVFGFFPWVAVVEETTEVIVYPALHPVELLIEEGLAAGNLLISDPLYEDLTRYRSIRDYMPGDELRRIHWKVSARMGCLQTKEFLPTYYYGVFIVLNLSCAAYSIRMRSTRMERAIETAAALVMFSLERGQNVGLVSNGIDSATGSCLSCPIREGHGHSVTLLEGLARVGPIDHDWEGLVKEGIDLPFGTRIFYVGPPMEEALLSLFISRWGKERQVDFFHIQTEAAGTGTGVSASALAAGRYRCFTVRDYGEEMIDV